MNAEKLEALDRFIEAGQELIAALTQAVTDDTPPLLVKQILRRQEDYRQAVVALRETLVA